MLLSLILTMWLRASLKRQNSTIERPNLIRLSFLELCNIGCDLEIDLKSYEAEVTSLIVILGQF